MKISITVNCLVFLFSPFVSIKDAEFSLDFLNDLCLKYFFVVLQGFFMSSLFFIFPLSHLLHRHFDQHCSPLFKQTQCEKYFFCVCVFAL